MFLINPNLLSIKVYTRLPVLFLTIWNNQTADRTLLVLHFDILIQNGTLFPVWVTMVTKCGFWAWGEGIRISVKLAICILWETKTRHHLFYLQYSLQYTTYKEKKILFFPFFSFFFSGFCDLILHRHRPDSGLVVRVSALILGGRRFDPRPGL